MKRKISLSSRRSFGQEGDSPIALLWVRTWVGTFAPIRFCFDTGADLSAIPIPLAQREGISFPRTEAARRTAVGLVGRAGTFRGTFCVRIAGVEYTWPCDFLDNPGPPTLDPYGVIGPAGFLDDFAMCVTKPYFTLRTRSFWSIMLPPWTPGHELEYPL